MSEHSDIFRLRDVEKRYESRVVLRINQLSIGPKQSVLFFGANGSGKSTLLKLLAGIVQPSRGRVERLLSPGSERCGYVSQFGQGYEDLTLMENFSILSRLFGRVERKQRECFREYAEFLGLDNYYEKKLREMSGGFRKISSLICVVSVQPSVLLLDEPSNQLDENKTRLVYQLLERERANRTLIVTEHALPVSGFWGRVYKLTAGALE